MNEIDKYNKDCEDFENRLTMTEVMLIGFGEQITAMKKVAEATYLFLDDPRLAIFAAKHPELRQKMQNLYEAISKLP
jgi:hypothetical protein